MPGALYGHGSEARAFFAGACSGAYVLCQRGHTFNSALAGAVAMAYTAAGNITGPGAFAGFGGGAVCAAGWFAARIGSVAHASSSGIGFNGLRADGRARCFVVTAAQRMAGDVARSGLLAFVFGPFEAGVNVYTFSSYEWA